MGLRLYDLGDIPEVPDAPPSGGFLRAGDRLLRLGPAGVVWTLRTPEPARWSVGGPLVYVVAGGDLRALDARTGDTRWSAAVGGAVAEVAADGDGVVLLAGEPGARWTRGWTAHGEAGEPADAGACDRVVRVAGTVWLGAEDGVYRLAGERATRVLAARCRALLARPSGVQALVDTAQGRPGLMEDDGMPLVWGFLSPDDTALLPWGDAEWLACDRATGRGLRVVDRRLQARWTPDLHVPLRDLATAGGCAVAELVGDTPRIAILHPSTPEPLELYVDGVDALYGDGPFLLVTHGGVSRLYWIG